MIHPRWLLAATLLMGGHASAETLSVEIHALDENGTGDSLGEVRVSDNPHGTLFEPSLKGLTPGLHGFHVHEHPDCGPGKKGGEHKPGLSAGGHYDPEKTGRHEGPFGKGHLGDLPALVVDQNGEATHPVLAPRLKLSDLRGRALMIHKGGDTYSDRPELGGGGARVACGVVE